MFLIKRQVLRDPIHRGRGGEDNPTYSDLIHHLQLGTFDEMTHDVDNMMEISDGNL